MRGNVKDWAALLTAIAALIGVCGNTFRAQEAKADTERLRSDSAEYTIPEVLKLQDRVDALEKTCGVKP